MPKVEGIARYGNRVLHGARHVFQPQNALAKPQVSGPRHKPFRHQKSRYDEARNTDCQIARKLPFLVHVSP